MCTMLKWCYCLVLGVTGGHRPLRTDSPWNVLCIGPNRYPTMF